MFDCQKKTYNLKMFFSSIPKLLQTNLLLSNSFNSKHLVKQLSSKKVIATGCKHQIAPLVDSYNRKHNYLRLSITDKCNLRCTYCMPAKGVIEQEASEYLSIGEYERLASLFVNKCLVNKIRLTGGEPTLVHRKLITILEVLNSFKSSSNNSSKLVNCPSLNQIAITTNGLTLKRNAKLYKELGVDCVNVSLDTLNEVKYKQISRRDGFKLAMGGIFEALHVGFEKVKVNCVLMKNFNDNEVLEFVELARKYPLEVRFIEFMPFGGNEWSSDKLVSYENTVKLIKEKYPDFVERKRINDSESDHQPFVSNGDIGKSIKEQHTIDDNTQENQQIKESLEDNYFEDIRNKQEVKSSSTCKLFDSKSTDFAGSVGFISSLTDNFCSECNRLRVTADGMFKACLFDKREMSLKGLMRNGASDDEIVESIRLSLRGKKKQHSAETTSSQLLTADKLVDSNKQDDEPQDNNKQTNFSHLNDKGKVQMVDISGKGLLKRQATACGRIKVGQLVLNKLVNKQDNNEFKSSMPKGDVIATAKIAGILAAKQTANLIPLCHQIELSHISIDVDFDYTSFDCVVKTKVSTVKHSTGVEMESLVATTTALLTIYDMCKSLNKNMIIYDVKLVSKFKSDSVI